MLAVATRRGNLSGVAGRPLPSVEARPCEQHRACGEERRRHRGHAHEDRGDAEPSSQRTRRRNLADGEDRSGDRPGQTCNQTHGRESEANRRLRTNGVDERRAREWDGERQRGDEQRAPGNGVRHELAVFSRRRRRTPTASAGEASLEGGGSAPARRNGSTRHAHRGREAVARSVAWSARVRRSFRGAGRAERSADHMERSAERPARRAGRPARSTERPARQTGRAARPTERPARPAEWPARRIARPARSAGRPARQTGRLAEHATRPARFAERLARRTGRLAASTGRSAQRTGRRSPLAREGAIRDF